MHACMSCDRVAVVITKEYGNRFSGLGWGATVYWCAECWEAVGIDQTATNPAPMSIDCTGVKA